MTARVAHPPHPDFAAQAVALDDEHESINAALAKVARSSELHGRDLDAIMQRMEEHRAATEELRRRYYPRAHRLVIVDGRAITASRTGRSVRTVWSRTPDHA